ncbi:MAG: glycosyltransferase family 4 protein [Acidimicrobiales bacterium]
MTTYGGGPLVMVNNSDETFTPTVSGAIGTCLWELCRAATTEGVTPLVVTKDADAEPYPWSETRFVPAPAPPKDRGATFVHRVVARSSGWGSVGQLTYARQARTVLRSLAPSLIVCHNDPELAVFLRRTFPDVRVVHHFHNLLRPSDRFRRRYTADRGLITVAVSAYLARAVEMAYELAPLSVPVVHNGVDTARFRPPDALVDDQRRQVIGFVGRICVEKAPDTLLRACLALSETRRDFVVQLVGDTNWGWSEPTGTRAVVDRLSTELSERGIEVRRTGHVARENVPAALMGSDIHVVPSRWDEPCALTVLEGLATGVPVVASATGGNPELIGDAGLLFPRDDVFGLADALGTLLDDPGLRSKLGARARDRAGSFTWLRTWQALAGAAVRDSEDSEDSEVVP